MRYLASFIVGFLVAAGLSSAWSGYQSARSPHAFASAVAVGDWMARYYRAPDPARLPKALAALGDAGAFDDPARSATMVGFLAGVIETDIRALDRLAAGLRRAPISQQQVVARAIAHSGRKDWQALLTKLKQRLGGDQPEINGLLVATPVHVLHLPLDKPAAIDMQWAYFMATGKQEPVERIISVLGGTLQDADLSRMMVGYAAKWSLAANAGMHPRVLETCRSAAAQHEPVAEVLKDVVAAAELQETKPGQRQWDVLPRALKGRQPRTPS